MTLPGKHTGYPDGGFADTWYNLLPGVAGLAAGYYAGGTFTGEYNGALAVGCLGLGFALDGS